MAIRWAAIWSMVAVLALEGVAQEAPSRVVVLGFDGADPARIRNYVANDELPNLARLIERYGLRDLATTTPAQSPVSWSSLITGLNPGKTGVFGFVRLVDDGGPSLALTTTEWRDVELIDERTRWFMVIGSAAGLAGLVIVVLKLFGARRSLAVGAGVIVGVAIGLATSHFLFRIVPPDARALHLLRAGTPFYQRAAEQGIPSVALSAPMDAPPPATPNLRILSGLGMPDISGTTGSWSVFTTEPIVAEVGDGGRVVLLDGEGPSFSSHVLGQVDPFVAKELRDLDRDRAGDFEAGAELAAERRRLEARRCVRVALGLEWRRGEPRVRITLAGTSVTVGAGQWSPLIPVHFRVNPIVGARGLVRFHVARADDELRVYQEPIGLDPRYANPRVPLSHPPAFARELEGLVGPFETAGWACATNAARDEMIDEVAFVDDVHSVLAKREAMLTSMLARSDWRLLFATFTGIDRLQHLLGRHLDPGHPRHVVDEAEIGRRRVLGAYRAMDAIVGRVVSHLALSDTLLIVSDHGFAAYGWSVNLNDWLMRNGYLVRKGGGARGFDAIDWKQTKAFACGLGQIYVNRSDAPHGKGVLGPVAARRVAREIAAKLRNLRHRGREVVRVVALGDDVFVGPFRARGPDLVPGLETGYRVGAATVFGGIAGRVFTPNDDRWSGDHCSVDPARVPGILISTAPLAERRIRVIDVAPTIYSLLGVSPPDDIDGESAFRGR